MAGAGRCRDDQILWGRASAQGARPVSHPAKMYFEEGRKLFVHAGFDTAIGVKKTPQEMLIWDRMLALEARGRMKSRRNSGSKGMMKFLSATRRSFFFMR